MFGVAGIDKGAMKAEAPAIMDQIAEAGITRVFEAGQPINRIDDFLPPARQPARTCAIKPLSVEVTVTKRQRINR